MGYIQWRDLFNLLHSSLSDPRFLLDFEPKGILQFLISNVRLVYMMYIV